MDFYQEQRGVLSTALPSPAWRNLRRGREAGACRRPASVLRRHKCKSNCRWRQIFRRERVRNGFGGFLDSPGRLRPGRSAGFHWPRPMKTGKRKYAQPEARGRAWCLLTTCGPRASRRSCRWKRRRRSRRSFEPAGFESSATSITISGCWDQLCDGHRNMSRCPRVTVLSANHSGALRFHEAAGK